MDFTTNITMVTHTDGNDGSGNPPASIIRKYFQWCKDVLLEPTAFFRKQYQKFDLNEALTFGLATLWLSSLVSFVWDALNQVFMVRFLEHWMQDVLFQEEAVSFLDYGGKGFLFSAGYILLTPFLSLLGLIFSSLFLLVLAKAFIPDITRAREQISMRSALKILAIASTGAWFSVVPFLGSILSYIAVSLLTMIGIREVYGASTRRSAVIVFLPQVLVILALTILILFVMVIFFSLPWDALAEV